MKNIVQLTASCYPSICFLPLFPAAPFTSSTAARCSCSCTVFACTGLPLICQGNILWSPALWPTGVRTKRCSIWLNCVVAEFSLVTEGLKISDCSPKMWHKNLQGAKQVKACAPAPRRSLAGQPEASKHPAQVEWDFTASSYLMTEHCSKLHFSNSVWWLWKFFLLSNITHIIGYLEFPIIPHFLLSSPKERIITSHSCSPVDSFGVLCFCVLNHISFHKTTYFKIFLR